MFAKNKNRVYFLEWTLFLILFLVFLGWVEKSWAGTLKGVGGLEAEPPYWSEFSNALPNNGFESGTSNWTLGSGCSVTNTNPSSGTSSLECAGSFGNNSHVSVPIDLGFRIKGKVFPTAGATGKVIVGIFNTSRGTTASASISLEVGNNIVENQWNSFMTNEGSYTRFGMQGDNLQLRIYRSSSTGTFFFDDIELAPLVPIVRSWIKYPNFRGYIWSDKSQIITGVVEANAPEGRLLSDYKAVVSMYKVIDSGDDQLVSSESLQTLTDGEADFSFDVGSYANDDEFIIKTSLQEKTNNEEVAIFPDWRVIKKGELERDSFPVYIDDDNKVVRNGSKHFIYGVYDRFSGYRCSNCVWNDKNTYINNMLGFNGLKTIENYQDTRANATIYFSPMSGGNPGFSPGSSDPNNPETKVSSLDTISPWADALNDYSAGHFHILQDFYSGKTYRPSWAAALTDSQLWKVIATYINSPGLLGYYTADEPDLSDGRVTHTQGWNAYEALRGNDNSHPVFAVMYSPGAGHRWRNLVDIIGVDPYPIGRGVLASDYLYGDTTGPFMGQVKQYIEELRREVHESRPVIAVLQLFAQGGQFPTLGQMRQMAWKAVIEGADGILWWGFVSASGMEYKWYGGYMAECNPKPCNGNTAYDDYRQVSSEIMDLEPVLLSDDATGLVSCDNPDIDYVAKEYNGKLYVIASNSKDSSQNGVSFTINQEGDGPSSSTVLYESRTINVQANVFSDDFSNYDVHLYEMDFRDITSPAAPSGLSVI